jgi:hypothetical protein
MAKEDELEIPEWLPLNAREEQLLEECSRDALELTEDQQKQTRASLFSKRLIERAGMSENYVQTYRATAKGVRALEITKIMKRLGMTRPARLIIRRADKGDLSELLAELKRRAAEESTGKNEGS